MSHGPDGRAQRVAFLVTSLSGSGHLVRTLALAEATAALGARVLVISGGRPIAHLARDAIPMAQLPPLIVAGRDFSRPLDSKGRLADAALMSARVAALEAAVATFAPDVLVTETWPFGRRNLRSEFEAAIRVARAARPALRLIASVRDVPEPPSRPQKLEAAAARLKDGFEALLVHGESEFLPLSVTWPLAPGGPPLHHTGYVATRTEDAETSAEGGDVLVAVGGGDLGTALLEIAAEGSGSTSLTWRLRVGGNDAAARAGALRTRYPSSRLIIEPAASDYRQRLAAAAVSVSLAGYNTVTDLAPLGVPALLVPDETAGEREQAIRAEALAKFEGIDVARLETLDPAKLAARVEALAAGPRRPPLPLDLDGARRSARLILGEAA